MKFRPPPRWPFDLGAPAVLALLFSFATLTAAALSGGEARESAPRRSGEAGHTPSAEAAEAPGLASEGARARSARSAVGGGAVGGGPKAGAPPAAASPGAGAAAGTQAPADPDPSYDGRFTFLRIQYGERDTGSGLRGFGRRGREPPWAHDTPRAERNFAKILSEVSYVEAYLEGGRVVTFDDPALFQYPVAYIVEVGFWRPTDAEVEALRAFLLKGGFLIVDDFRGRDIWNFEEQFQRVIPGARMIQLDGTHDIFDSFFHIADPLAMVPAYGNEPPVYLGIFEENDPEGRLMAIVNYNNDLAEYWEFSDVGYYPIDLSNEAYKFGVNYIIYAMTH